MSVHTYRALCQDARGYAQTTGTKTFAVQAGTPQPAKPLFGMASGTLSTFNTVDQQAGPMRLRRSFLSPPPGQPYSSTPNAVNITTMLADQLAGRASMWSFKPDPVKFAAGMYDVEFKALLRSIRHRVFMGLWHEPGTEFRSGLFTTVQWKAANVRMCELIKANGNPLITSFICIEGAWAFTTAGFAQYDYWDNRFSGLLDHIGFDQYSRGGQPPVESVLTTRTSAMAIAPIAWARARGMRMVIPEYGISDELGQTEKARRIKSLYDWAVAARDVDAVCYFNNNKDTATSPWATWEVHDQSLVALRETAAAARV